MFVFVIFGEFQKVSSSSYYSLYYYYYSCFERLEEWFLEITFVRNVSMRVCVCVCVCVSTPEAINN